MKSDMTVEIIGKCNQSCPFCYFQKSDYVMDIKIFKKIVVDLKNKNFKTIILTGGETFLHPNIFEFIDFINEMSLNCNVLTNGTLLTNECLRRIENKVKIVNISIHETDLIRGDIVSSLNNSTEKRLQVLKRLSNYNIRTIVLITIVKSNYERLDKIVTDILNINRNITIMFNDFVINKDIFDDDEINRNIVKYSESKKYIIDAIEIINELGGKYTLNGIPPCIFKERKDIMYSILKFGSRGFNYMKQEVETFLSYNFMKSTNCNACKLYRFCPGFSKSYYDFNKDIELNPI